MGETRVPVVRGVGGLSAAASLADAGWDGHFAQISGEHYNATKGTALGLGHTLRRRPFYGPRTARRPSMNFTSRARTPPLESGFRCV